MNTNIQKVLVFFTIMAIVKGSVLPTTQSQSSKCNGSLFLTPPGYGSPTVYLTGQFSLDKIKNFPKKINLAEVEVHGCGCFQVYSKRDGRGLTFIIRSEESMDKDDDRFFKKAKSIKRVMCKPIKY